MLHSLLDAGADPQDLAEKLRGPSEAGDEELGLPLGSAARDRMGAATGCRGGERSRAAHGSDVVGLLAEASERPAWGLPAANRFAGTSSVDALGRYRARPDGRALMRRRSTRAPSTTAATSALADGVEHMDAPLLNPRGDLGYMGFNTFRGDNRTFAVILLAPAQDRELRALRHDHAWRAACASIRPLDVMTSADYGRPITDVMPMGGLMNVDRTGDPGSATSSPSGTPCATPTGLRLRPLVLARARGGARTGGNRWRAPG